MIFRKTSIAVGTLLVTLAACSPDYPGRIPWSLSDLEIEVADTSREVSFTNTRAGFYYTESNATHRSSWQGWHISSVRLLSDYQLDLDGRPLDRTTADYARVWPHQLTRSYHEGVQETLILLDSVDALLVSLENLRSRTVGLSLVFGLSSRFEDPPLIRDGILIFSPFTSAQRSIRPDVPGWIGMTAVGGGSVVTDTLFASGQSLVRGEIRRDVNDGAAGFIIAAGSSPDDVAAVLRSIRDDPEAARQQRISRMERILQQTPLRSSNERFDKAFAWALLSMDALIMEQGRKGIFAGLPWFSNYWGRDTFISLPGATLVTGRYDVAREVLRSFARWQNTDPASPFEGRIPNIVTPTSLAYNTADGTPWFILGVYDYVRSSGDTSFARELYPVIRRAVEGPYRHRSDANGFLTHDDAETWMDAVGPEGPWSPRGNRANDIQALWYRQLAASASIAGLLGMPADAERWGLLAEKVRLSFPAHFLHPDDDIVFDHIRADGSPDTSIRPNQLFALDLVPSDDMRARIFGRLTHDLVYEHGVGSLSPHDVNFHPFHHVEPLYVQDAAYHNGIVWTWQNGPWIEHAVRFGKSDLAFRVTDNMVHQILDRGAVGTISELLDAAPRPAEQEPRLSGTFSQAWSLAEFIRTTFRSYLGVRADAVNQQVWLQPRLPKDLQAVSFSTAVGATELDVSYAGNGRAGHIRLGTSDANAALSVSSSWVFDNGMERSVSIEIRGVSDIELILTPEGATAESHDGTAIPLDTQVRTLPVFPALDSLALATPLVRDGLPSLAGPSYDRIPHAVIKRNEPDATLIAAATDARGDDTGTGTYSYPTTTHLRPGSLDILGFDVFTTDSVATFELRFDALSDPGWHPEYGFQLTYAAIAIDTDRTPGSGTRTVGRNARYLLPSGWEYETIVFVGGGLQVEDGKGNILGAYLPAPADVRDPLGDAGEATIRFSLPISLIGRPSASWRYTVLVGAQDDHGGAGIGEFRNVDAAGGEWIGGGKRRPADPNVYDVLHYP